MSCKCSKWDMDEGYKCSVTGDGCVFMIPNSKACAEMFGEGPDADGEDEYVIIYKTGAFARETYINAQNEEDAIKKFKETVGNYEIQSCELSDED